MSLALLLTRSHQRLNRAHTHKSKYARKDIMILFDLFNEYDEDGSGSISMQELSYHFDDRVGEAQYSYQDSKYTGERVKSFAQRRAERANLDLAQLVQPMFEAVDVDHSGTIGFIELCKLIYPAANETDLENFRKWCYPEKP